MGIKSLIKYGTQNDNIRIKLYFMACMGWVGILLLIDLLVILIGGGDVSSGGTTIGELVYILGVLNILGLIPLAPILLLYKKKQSAKKPEEAEGEPKKEKEEAPSEKPAKEKKKKADEEPAKEEAPEKK